MHALVLFCLLMTAPVDGFASVQSVWWACHVLTPAFESPQSCMCNQSNFEHFSWAMLADASLLGSWTGLDFCDFPMDFFHGSSNEHFLEFVSWVYLFGESTGDHELMDGALWMALDPSTDGASLWHEGNGGIEGQGFSPTALYDVILPMASGLDSWLYWNNSCGFNEIVARAMSKNTLNKIYNVVLFAQSHGANWTNVPSRENMTQCLHAWQTEGISNWMANFVAPVSSQVGLEQFAQHVRFNQNASVTNAIALHNAVATCSKSIWSSWISSLKSTNAQPLERVQQAQASAYKTLSLLMKQGQCGAPPY